MRKILLVLFSLCTVFLSSCADSRLGVESLLRPPRFNEEQTAIYTALTKELQTEDIKLIYPQKGSYRSAFTVVNLDSEPSAEAIVFYQPASSAAVRVNLLDQQDGSWTSFYDMALEGTQVEDVDILNIGTGTPVLAMGLNFVSDGSSLLRLFTLKDGLLEGVTSYKYQVKAMEDFNEDGVDDILIIDTKEDDIASQAKLISFGGSSFFEVNSVYINPNITQYGGVQVGYLPSGRKAVFLDAYTGTDSMTTEILSFSKEQGTAYEVVNLTSGGGHVPNAVDRPAGGAFCHDWDNDGIIEVPGLILMPGYTAGSVSTAYLTDWYNYYEDKGFSYCKSSYVNNALGYALDYPESWIGKVSVRQTAEENELLFFEYGTYASDHVKNELLCIKVAKKNDWDEGKYSDYSLIHSQGQIVYLAKIPAGQKSPLRVNITQVKKAFSLYK